MSGQIKGIVIEFKGDTTSLDKALRKIKTDSKSVDSELKKVNNALKFNPKNTELLSQKQGLLKQKVEQTSQSLKELKDIQEKMDADGVDKQSTEYQALRREIITTESKLKHFRGELAKVNAQSSKIYKLGTAFDSAGKKIEAAGRKLAPVSKAAGAVTLAIGGVTLKASKAADELNTLSKQTGISTQDLQLYAAAADLTDVSVEAMAKSQKTLKKNMFSASEGKSQKKYFDDLGVSVVDADGNLRDSNDVFKDSIKALGKIENETQRDAIAMKLFGKSASDLNPIIEDGGATYEKVSKILEEHGLEPVSQEELDKANEFNDAIDTIKLVFIQAAQIIGTKIASYLLPLMTKVTNAAANIAQKIASLSGGKLAKLGGLSAAFAALSPVLIVVGKALQAVGGKFQKVALFVEKMALKFPKLAKVFRLFTNPIALVVAAIAGLGLAIGKSGKSADELVKSFDKMVKKGAAKFKELIPKVVAVLKNVASAIVKNLPVMLKGIATLIEAVLKAFIKYAPKLVKGAVTLFTSLVSGVTKVAPKVLTAIAKLIGSVLKALPKFVPLILKAAVTAFMAIVQAVPQVVKALVEALPTILTTVVGFFGEVLDGIKGVFAGLKDWFKDKFTKAVDGVKEGFTNIKGHFTDKWNGIKGVFDKVKDFFKTKFTNAVTGIKEGFVNITSHFTDKWTAIKGVFSTVKGWFKDKFTAAVSGIKEGFTGVASWFGERWTAIKDKFGNVKEWFATKFGAAWSAIKGKFSGWGEFWGGLWTKIKNKFKSIGSNISIAISTTIKSGLNKLLSALESKLNHVIVTINSIITGINKYTPLNIGTLSAVQLPRLAKGGIVDSATLALIGEGRSSEAVIPLDELWKRLDKMTESLTGTGGGAPIVVNVYGAEGQSVDSLAKAVQARIIEMEKRRRNAWA